MSKTTTGYQLSAILLAVLLSACSGDKPSQDSTTQAPSTAPKPSATQTPAAPATANNSNLPSGGKVLRALHAGGYTYMQLEDDEGRQFWVAASMMNVKHNDHIAWDSAALQTDFNSSALHRHFDEILFVTSARNEH